MLVHNNIIPQETKSRTHSTSFPLSNIKVNDVCTNIKYITHIIERESVGQKKYRREREMMKKKAPLFLSLIITFFFFFCISHVHSQTPSSDSCSSDPLTLQSPLPFNTSSLHCVPVWSAQSFILRYIQESQNVWNFVLSAPNTNGYIAIGFSPDGNMIGSRAVVGWVGGDGTTNLKKYYLGGQSPNEVTIEPADAPGLRLSGNSSSVILQSNTIYMYFQVISDATPTARLIYSVGPSRRLPSGPDFRLSEHQERISTTLNYATGTFQNNKHRPVTSLRRSHGILNLLGWAILLPIGAMVARYMRQWDPIWFYSHAMIQSLGFVLGVIGVICGLVLENRLTSSVKKHKGIGITVLVLGCLQVIAILARPDKEAKIRKYWNWYHFGVGRLLIFLAAVNVFYGIHLGNAGSSWNAGFAAFLVVVFILTVILELRICFKR